MGNCREGAFQFRSDETFAADGEWFDSGNWAPGNRCKVKEGGLLRSARILDIFVVFLAYCCTC